MHIIRRTGLRRIESGLTAIDSVVIDGISGRVFEDSGRYYLSPFLGQRRGYKRGIRNGTVMTVNYHLGSSRKYKVEL